MSSPRPRDAGHGLDLAPGREVVFCHACQNEWYRDEHSGSMRCPTCSSEAVEIVDPDSDPRLHQDPLPILGHRHHSHRHDNSDPEEEDIEEHVTHHPGGFFMRQAIFDSRSRPRGEQAGSPGRRRPADASNNDEVLQRFGELLAGLGVDMPPPGGRVPGLNRGRRDNDPLADDAPPPPSLGFFGAPRVRTFRAGPLSGASITISTGAPVRPEAGGPADFGPVFGSILSNGPLPAAAGDRRGAGEGVPLEFGLGLQELLTTLFDPSRAVRGDAVYTQEALDRIITTLMENNPQSNAAPPASQAAIERLQKKKVDSEMLGNDGRAECTICIDDLHLGDEVTVLPCKHWFHEECVVLWLKEHNTCPVCRAPIEKANTDAATGSSPQDNATRPARPQGSANAANAAPPSNPSSAPGGANTRYMGFFGQQWAQPQPPPGPPPPGFANATRPQMGGTSESSRGATSSQSIRSQRATNADRLERLNRVRAAAELPPETSMSRTYGGSSSSSLPGEGSGQPGSRRTSNSPPSLRTPSCGHQQPRQAGGGSGASRRRHSQQQQGGSLARGRGARDRSPSYPRRTRDSVSGGSGGGSGVMEASLHWLRDHLGGGGSGSSSNNGDRDRRRS